MKTFGKLAHEPETGMWWITAVPHVAMRVKRIFPRVRTSSSGVITVRDTPEVARDLEWLVTRWPLATDDDTAAHLARRAGGHRETETAIGRILDGGQHLIPTAHTPAREPRPYQVQAADLALATGRLLLTDDVGLGKSMSGLLLLRGPAALPALVVTLTHLPRQWLCELTKTFPDMVGHVLRNGDVYDPTERCGSRPDVVITSYSKLARWSQHLAGAFRTVIFDEIQELRRDDSDRYRAAAHIAGEAAFRIGLTATPVYNYSGEIHNVINVLAPDSLGSRDEFLREWSGVITGFAGNVPVGQADAMFDALLEHMTNALTVARRRDYPNEVEVPAWLAS